MKKTISLLLALVLCFALTAGALADFTLTQVASGSNIDFISDSNLIRVGASDGYHVMKLDGTAFSSEAYSSSFDYEYGYLLVESTQSVLNDEGMLDAQGNVVIPVEYGDVKVLNKNWALGIKLTEATADHYDYTIYGSKQDSYALIDTVDVYNLVKGVCVASIPRANYKDADVVYDIINIEDRASGTITSYNQDFTALGTVKYTWEDEYATPDLVTYRANGQYGLMDAAGNVIMQPSFYSINSFNGEYATVYTGETYGLIDRQGNVIVPAEYEKINRGYYTPYDVNYGSGNYNAGGYICVVKNGKLGYVNDQGVVTCEPKYSESIMDNYGASAVYTDMEGKMHILAADGVDTVIEGYENVYPLSYCNGKLFRVTNANYDYGVIDWHGNVVLPTEYDGVGVSGDGRYLLVDVDYQNSVIYEITDTAAPVVVAAAPAAAPAAPALDTTAASAPAAPAAPAADAAQADGGAVSQGAANARAAVGALLGAGQNAAAAAVEEPAASAPAAPAAAAPVLSEAERNLAAKTLIDAAIAKLGEENANMADVAELVNGAITLLGEVNPSATTLLSTTLPLVEGGNGEAAKTILESIKMIL